VTSHGLSWLVLAALCTVAANLLLRAGVLRAGGFFFSGAVVRRQVLALATQPMFALGLLLYGLAAVIWFRVISTEELSTSYPLLVSLTFVLVTIGAACCFNEHVSWQKVVGMLVILAGFVLVARA
jgi:multidrug transporter EmrE-like cation transporter